jgi:signal transduction histidine kinase
MLIDGEGTILTRHPAGEKKAGSSIAGSPLLRFATGSGNAGLGDNIEWEGKPYIWASGTLPSFENTGVRVLIGISANDLLATANKRLISSLVILMTIWIFVFAGAWALAERAIRRPTARIIETVARFSNGDFTARIGAPYPRGEIGALMVALDHAFETVKRQHQVIEQLNADLERRVTVRTAELEIANKELEAFSYTVSHDLRAPVRHVGGFARLALEHAHALDAVTQRHIEKIANAAERMGAMIDDLLMLSRAGRRELKSERVDLAALMNDVREEAMRDAAGRNIVWKIGALPVVEGDAGLLRQAFVNLVGNAVKYSAGVAETIIEINAEHAGPEQVQISVRDNGTGFDMAYANKLFGVFQRLHSDERFSGTGIGLATVKRIIERHGGRVWADAAVGRGATFYVTLKRAA